MKKIIVFSCIICLTAAFAEGQTINNKNWKATFGDPINDSLVFHIHSDSSFVVNSKGETILRTSCIIHKDTLTLSDYGTGNYTCPDMLGQYLIHSTGTSFTLALLNDKCEGRVHALNGTKWTEIRK